MTHPPCHSATQRRLGKQPRGSSRYRRDDARPIQTSLRAWRLCLSAGLGAVALVGSDAFAQVDNAAAEWNVAARSRPAWDPAGVRAGGFALFPSIELGVGNDDNIYRVPRGETSDSIRSVRPRFIGVSQWRNHEIVLDAGADASFFADAEDEDVTNWFAGGAGRLDIARDAWVRAQLNVRELHEERGDPESPATAVRPISRRMSGARIEAFRRANRLSLGIEGSYTGIAYEDSVDGVTGRRLVQNDRNRGEGEISARVGLDVALGYEAYVRATRYSRSYERPQGEDMYRRDSDGTEIALGSRLDLGTVLAGDLFAGFRSQSYDEDERLPTVEGTSFGGALTWNVTPLTTLRATASRTVNESTLRQASGYLSSSLELGLDHELRRNVLFGVDIAQTGNQYVGIDREDDITTATIRGTWLINRTVHADFGYRMQRRDSTVERDDYDKNLLYLDVRLSL